MSIMEDLQEALKEIGQFAANNDTNAPATTVAPQMPTFGAKDPFWYLGLTSSDNFNVELGIKSIKFTPAAKPGKAPSAAQMSAGVIGRVSIKTYYATMNNIPVFAKVASTPVDGNKFYLYCKNPSYLFKDKRISDGKLTSEAQAQILNFVMTMIDQNTPGDYPNLLTPARGLWWLEEQDDIIVSDDLISCGFVPAKSDKQRAAHIAGKAYFDTPALSVNNCTIFSYLLDTPVDGHKYDLRITNPTYKDGNGEQRSDVFLTADIKKILCLYIDSQIES